MLVMTLTAFALDFTDYRKVTLGGNTPTESNNEKLSITDNGDGTYNVTFNDIINKDGSYTDKYGTFTFSNVSGSQTGDFTTVTGTNLTGTVTGGDYGLKSFTDGELLVKFKDGKAYATMTAKCKVFYSNYTFNVVFGTDEGFEGGGSTGGGEEKPAAFEKVNFVGDGTNFNWSIPVDWDTQKIVMSISTATCTTGCEHIIGLGTDGTSWAGNLHMYRTSADQQLQCYFGAGAINTGKFDEGNPIKVEISKANGLVVDGTTRITASQLSDLFAMSTVTMGTGEGNNILSHATYNYVKVVDKDWTETVEPEVTVTFEKQYADQLYSLAGATPSPMGDATVTLKEMSDNTISMALAFSGMNVESTDLVKGTDEKERITYTGTANFQGTNYAVKALRYTENEEEKLYMTLTPTDGTTLAFGTDPDYVAPAEPEDVTLWENYQADGTGFSKTATIDWDKQKIVASIDFSNGGDDKDILAMTTGDSFAAFQTSTYRTMHWYCQQSVKQMSGFFAKSGSGNNNTGRFDVADCLAKFEISKAEGLKVNGEVKMAPYVLDELFASNTILIGSGESPKFSQAFYKYIKVVSLDWTEPTEPEVTVKEEKTFNEALYMVQGTTSTKVADAKVVVKEMSDETINMSLQFNGNEYTSTELVKGTDEKNRTTYTGKISNGTQTFDVAGVVYEKETADRLYMTMTATGVTFVVGENPDVVTPEVTEVSNKTYTSNLRILDGETTVVEEAEANVNIVKYSDESYKVTLKDVNILNKTQDLVFVGKAIVEEVPTEGVQPLTIMAKSDEATTTVFGEQVSGTFEITEVSADEIKMGFSMESQNFSYQGEFNYTEVVDPEVYTNNLHIYDAAAPETDLFQADQAKVEFLATETGEFKLTLKDVTLNEKTQDLVFTGTLPTPQPGGQDPLAEEGETTPAEPAMVLNAIADEATATFLGATSATAVFNVIMNDEAETENDAFALTFTITAGEKTLGGEFNYVKKDPETPDPELFCKENYVADGTGFEWDINVDWDTQKIVMSIDPSTCTGSCEDVIGLGAVPTAWDNTLHLYRTSADQMLQGYFNVPGGSNNNTDKFAETAPFLVEVSKAQGFVVNNEVKIAASAMSYLFTLPTVKMGTGEGANDKSRATYNYVKVVDKDWTAPKDPDTGINATTVAEGEVEFFTVNGVKLNKLQKGLNIVRTADGKVKKVLVK